MIFVGKVIVALVAVFVAFFPVAVGISMSSRDAFWQYSMSAAAWLCGLLAVAGTIGASAIFVQYGLACGDCERKDREIRELSEALRGDK